MEDALARHKAIDPAYLQWLRLASGSRSRAHPEIAPQGFGDSAVLRKPLAVILPAAPKLDWPSSRLFWATRRAVSEELKDPFGLAHRTDLTTALPQSRGVWRSAGMGNFNGEPVPAG